MGNSKSTEDQLIEHYFMIHKQRWFIHDKLKELGYEDNWEIQRLYINECHRIKIININKIERKKTFFVKVKTPKVIYKNNIHKYTLNKIKEEEI